MNAMKHFPLAALLLIFAALAAACSEKDDGSEVYEYTDWQQKNDTYWNTLYSNAQQRIAAGDNSWRIITTWSKNESVATKSTDHIVVHVLSEGDGSEQPFYTDTVRVHYTGRLIPSPSHPQGFQFDTSMSGSYDSSIPYKAAASSFVDGFTTAVTNMHVGDRWEIYIPYQLGYGTSDRSDIPGYSTLIFDVTLAAFFHPGSLVPEWRAPFAAITGEW